MSEDIEGMPRGLSDWADLTVVDFTKDLDMIAEFSAMGSKISLHSADALDLALYHLHQAILKTSWLGGDTAEGRAKARRLLRPLDRTVHRSLPAAARRFHGLPDRFKNIYDAELHPRRSGGGGIPDPRRR